MTAEEEATSLAVAEQFAYPDLELRVFCEQAAQRIEDAERARVKLTIAVRLEIGRQLNAVRERLGYGRFGEWLRWRFPGWSEDSTRNWRVLAERVDKNPKISEILGCFRSSTAAVEFAGLPERVQLQVVQAGAWTWTAFQAVCWTAAMEERLEDQGLGFERRHGDVRHAIEEARDDPALAKAAEALFKDHSDTFARLEDRPAAHIAAEIGFERPEPMGNCPSAQLVEGGGEYALCRRLTVNGRETFLEVAPVRSHVLVWNNGATPQPLVLVAFPEPDGPVLAAWQSAAVDAVVRRLNASTVRQYVEEAL
jgi:hypothetical protein